MLAFDFIELVENDVKAEREKFKAAINEIRKKYGFTETGITVVKDATVDFCFEEIRELAKNKE